MLFEKKEYKERLTKVKSEMQKKGIDLLVSHDPANMNYLTGYDAWSFYYAQCVLVHVNEDEPICFLRAQDVGGAYIKTYLKDKNIINNKEPVIYLSPKGKKFDQIYAKKILDKNINIICGHFEGVDQRILETRNIEEVSIGDLILSGGEIGATVIIDTVVRLLPGVLGNANSLSEETFEKNLLEYPQYTKPQKWEEKEIPSVLLTGDHKKIKDWRLTQSEDITRRRRPDLWKKYKKNK